MKTNFSGAPQLGTDLLKLVDAFVDTNKVGRNQSVMAHAQAGALIGQIRDRLDMVPAGTDAREVTHVVRQALGQRLTGEEMLGVWERLRGLEPGQLARNVEAGFGPIVRGPDRAAKIPGPKLTKLDPTGSLNFARADITKMPADASICPNHAEDMPVGGIAHGWISKYQDLNGPDQPPTPPSEVKQFGNAVWAFQNGRDQEFERTYARGYAFAVATGLSERQAGPAYLVHTASVPPAGLRRSNAPADPAAAEKQRLDRVNFVQDATRKALFRLKQAVSSDPALAPSKSNPVRVTLPALSTGPEGALDCFESGYVMSRVLREFQAENEGYEFVIAMKPGSDTYEKDVADFQKGFAKDAKLGNYNPRFETAHEVLDQILGGFEKPVADGVPLTDSYLDSKLHSWASNFLPPMDVKTLNDRALARTMFSTRVATDAFHQLSKFLEIPDLAKLAGISVDSKQPVTEAAIQKLLGSEWLKTQVFALIKSKLADASESFGGNDNMPQIFSAAVAQVLQDVRWQHLDAFQGKFQAQMAALEADVQQKQAKLTSALSGKANEVEALKQRLLQEVDSGKEWQKAAESFKASVLKLTTENTELKKGEPAQLKSEIAALEAALRTARETAARLARSAEGMATSSYYSSPGRSGG